MRMRGEDAGSEAGGEVNLFSTNMRIEIARLAGGFIVIYRVDCGDGSRGTVSSPIILKNEDELKTYLASLTKDVT